MKKIIHDVITLIRSDDVIVTSSKTT